MDNRQGGFGGNQDREMHKAVCGDCGKECEVPFKPSGDRPVYCKECFGKHKKF
ncbi:DNA-directed RNA polymerase [Candidatus Woesearchaeota archaeon]|nr:DNA-directed RNA polymerase [Candidatus Woesearchaeota archaeon]MBT5396880.1 DNA-directed RNA polymerase [Candidatus Woesearchaeota archaeon]MBT6367073.1 DNA-directed RNA polymerase [Candidatus Woesearchaeota archaeon]MBT7762353.1 DNA-directed RNA polymerase [Candidatus Woesearchaeota archaeon]